MAQQKFGFDLDKNGHVSYTPVSGYSTIPLGSEGVLIRLEFSRAPGAATEAMQFLLTPGPAGEIGTALIKAAGTVILRAQQDSEKTSKS